MTQGGLQAVVFDYDGTIADSESLELVSWQAIWADHGHQLALEEWVQCVGTRGAWEPVAALSLLVGEPLDPDPLYERHRTWARDEHARLGMRDGVREWLDEAAAAGVRIGLASSSEHDYLDRSLQRLGVRDLFEAVVGWDDVGAAKPDPASYRAACRILGVEPSCALAVEDSPHGVTAARTAGLAVVACPGPVTTALDFSAADLVLGSLTECSLADAFARATTGVRS